MNRATVGLLLSFIFSLTSVLVVVSVVMVHILHFVAVGLKP